MAHFEFVASVSVMAFLNRRHRIAFLLNILTIDLVASRPATSTRDPTAGIPSWWLQPDPAPSRRFPIHRYLLGIINGDLAEQDEWPFMASIERNGHQHFCGGSVWNSNFILTAAHCAFDQNGKQFPAANISVYIGHTDISLIDPTYQFPAEELIPHPKYNQNAARGYDIALIRLKRAIDFRGANAGVKCVCQPNRDEHVLRNHCWVIGWGATNETEKKASMVQREVRVPIRSAEWCSEASGAEFDAAKQMCAGYDAGGKDSCQGDSGGPLMCAISTGPYVYQQAGVVSWGRGCAGASSPGYYTRVSYYRDWITEKTGC